MRFTKLVGALLAVFIFSSTGVVAEMKTHNVAFHVDQNDKGLMNPALNNIENMVKHYEAKG